MGSLVSAELTNNIIKRTSNIPVYNDASISGWTKIASGVKTEVSSSLICGFSIEDSLDIEVSPSGDIQMKRMAGSRGTIVAEASWSEEEWLYFAISAGSGGAGQTTYVWNAAGTLLGSDSRNDVHTPTWVAVDVAARWDAVRSCRGKYAYWKCWDAALSQAEFESEQFSPTFVRTTNANTGFADSATDIGPNGRDWTITGMTYDIEDPLSSGSGILLTASATYRMRTQ